MKTPSITDQSGTGISFLWISFGSLVLEKEDDDVDMFVLEWNNDSMIDSSIWWYDPSRSCKVCVCDCVCAVDEEVVVMSVSLSTVELRNMIPKQCSLDLIGMHGGGWSKVVAQRKAQEVGDRVRKSASSFDDAHVFSARLRKDLWARFVCVRHPLAKHELSTRLRQ